MVDFSENTCPKQTIVAGKSISGMSRGKKKETHYSIPIEKVG
jgi:hypothetical protein